jgi:TrmH family RNA methyltransferase
MLSKNLLSEIRSLQQLKYRRLKRRFVAAGEKVVGELLQSSFRVVMVLATRAYLDRLGNLPRHVQKIEVSDNELLKISFLNSPNKVLAVAEIPEPPVFSWFDVKAPLVVLDGIRDPGNLGTIIRTADWFGAGHVLCSEDTVDCFNPKVVQGAMGSLFRMPVLYGSLSAWLAEARSSDRFLVIGTTLDGQDYSGVRPDRIPVVVTGSESHGLSREVLDAVEIRITIPRSPRSHAESLNATVALGVVLSRFAK